MKKKLLLILCLILAAVLLLGMASFLCYRSFKVADPFAAAGGLLRILFTDTETVLLQEYPQVVLAKPDASLNDYMRKRKMYEKPDEQMGALRVFATESDDMKEYVLHSVNRYYQLWRWQ